MTKTGFTVLRSAHPKLKQWHQKKGQRMKMETCTSSSHSILSRTWPQSS